VPPRNSQPDLTRRLTGLEEGSPVLRWGMFLSVALPLFLAALAFAIDLACSS